MFDIGIVPEDFPALGLFEGDMVCYRAVEKDAHLPENHAVIVRNIHSGRLSIGYLEGSTLFLATETVRNFHDWGAEVLAIVTGTQRNFWSAKF